MPVLQEQKPVMATWRSAGVLSSPHGQWNDIRIVSQGPVVEHWINGEMVLRYERWTVEWFAMLRESKFREL